MLPYVICGTEWFNTVDRPVLDINEVGQKALGLSLLPNESTAPFFVITTQVFEKWKLEKLNETPYQGSELEWLEPYIDSYIQKLVSFYSHVVIRSSAVDESLADRGTHESLKSRCDTQSVIQTLSLLFKNEYKFENESGPLKIAFIIQGYIEPTLFGHFSNERRVSRNRNKWLYEIEGGLLFAEPEMHYMTCNSQVQNTNIDFQCTNKIAVIEVLRNLATLYSNAGQIRFHFEWVWNRNRLWIVQMDKEKVEHGSRPGSDWKVLAPKEKLPTNLKVFKPDFQTGDQWDKINCVRDFHKSGLNVANVFVLEDPEEITRLIEGDPTNEFLDDLQKLMLYPTIIRTDILRNKKEEGGFLLPRTETMMNIDQALTFLIENSKRFIAKGLRPGEFCFIAHRFIVSRSCAFSFTRPRSPIVMVDSTWGIPDGLNYNPHDTFLLIDNNGSPQIQKRKIRCKSEYLDVDTEGNWIQKMSGYHYDWNESLKKEELYEIYECSRKLADYLDKPVQIMFFIGVNPESGHPNVLPWFYTDHVVEDITVDISQRFGGERFVVSNKEDLDVLKNMYPEKKGSKQIRIHLKLKPDFLRDVQLLEQIAETAVEYKIPVELEGSVLSHAYYILRKHGVQVLCPDIWEISESPAQTFGKLVRDNIPELIQSHGENVGIVKLTKEDHLRFLKAKAIEEALELFWEHDETKAFEELADLYEVIRASCQLFGKTLDELEKEASKKRTARGGFERGLVLLETRIPNLLDINQPGLFNDVHDVKPIQQQNYNKEILLNSQKPKLNDNQIIVPLIPPTADKKGKTIIMLPRDGQKFVLQYDEKVVRISVQPIRSADEDNDQLSLF